MRQTIMGIDPGRVNTGVGLIRTDPCRYYKSRHIYTKGMGHAEGLFYTFNTLKNMVEKYNPDIIAFEKSSKSDDVVKVNTIIELVSEMYEIPLRGYAPATIKKVLTGNARADKKEVEKVVRTELEMNEGEMIDHIFDGLAAALTYVRKELDEQ